MNSSLSQAEGRLLDILRSLAPLAVAASGGADSTLLAKAASMALPEDELLLVHVRLPFSPPRETGRIVDWASKESLRLEVLDLNILDDASVRANGPRRCYHCKKLIMTTAFREIRALGFANLADGTVTDDYGDYRPGLEAAAELGVSRPLAEAGFDKRLTRLLARRYGIRDWNMPASACLASRIPCGAPITSEALARIAAAEEYLTDLGFAGCRVRHLNGEVASVEVPRGRLKRLFEVREDVERVLKSFGFECVELNPNGYVRGAMNPAR